MARTLALAIVVWVTALPALAQDTWGWSVIIPSVTGTDHLGTYFHNQGNARTSKPAAPPPSSASLRFTPSTERRAANFRRYLAQRQGGDAASVKQLQALLGDPTLMPRIEAELRRFGLRPDNVADAYTVWWINAWQAAHGQTGDPSLASTQAVKVQAERAFLAAPSLALSDEATKQALAEGLLVQAVILAGVTEQVKGDPSQLRVIGDLARQSARRFGLDLDAVALTDAGFVPQGRR